jgi:aldose 1-epimerase
MYQHNTGTFGRFEKHSIFNPLTQTGFEIVPERGAVLLSATFKGYNVIEGYTDPADLEDLKWGKSIVLYPFPNRLDEGKYSFEGKTYQFPINSPATNNAIHGLGRDVAHRVSAVVLASNYASMTCTYEYNGDLPYYPFPFRFDIEFFISDGSNMEIKMHLENTGTGNLPAGIGWHPYFALADNVGDVSMQCPEIQWIDIDDRMLPTGTKRTFADFVTLKNIADTALDNGFYIHKQNEPFGITLSSAIGTLRYWQEIGQGKYNFVQIFAPPHRKSIALEPMTCNINAFNNGDGLQNLAPSAFIEGSFGFSFLKNSN